jgi:bifunctional non-homologous end joining protein LigD
MQFIVPAQPRLRASPPTGDGWIHEVKFDGWRIQIHKFLDTVALYTRGGHHVERRFKSLVGAIEQLPIRSFIIDGEVTACDEQGLPDFRALHFRNDRGEALRIWAFDLLYTSNKDLRRLPLVDRKERLERLVSKADVPWLLYSDTFADGATLLAAADRMGLEGIVSKKATASYRSGTQSGWIKVKCPSWREANKERWRLFERN